MIDSADGRPSEPVRCGVALSLLDRQGQAAMKDVVYLIWGEEPVRFSVVVPIRIITPPGESAADAGRGEAVNQEQSLSVVF
jgi:hypothetical protein